MPQHPHRGEDPILTFEGDHAWLSNFHPSPFVLDGVPWPTVEHAFQAFKSLDPVVREHIRDQPSPGAARWEGRQLALRPDWEGVCYTVMVICVTAKFTQDAALARKLIATGTRHLEEGNRHGDRRWGTVDGRGENRLGQILMTVRTDLQAVLGPGDG